MEGGESCIISNSKDFDSSVFNNHKKKTEAFPLEIKRHFHEELQMESIDIKNFSDYVDDDDSDLFENYMDNCHQNFKLHGEQSSSERSVGWEEQTLSDISNEETFTEEDVSNVYSRPTRDYLSSLHLSSCSKHSSSPGNHLAEHSEKYFSDKDVLRICNNHSPRDERKDENISQLHSNTDDNERQSEYLDLASEDWAKYSIDKRSYVTESPSTICKTKSFLKKNESVNWEETYRTLQILFEVRGEELNKYVKKNIKLKKKIKSLQLTLSRVKGEKDTLFAVLQESQKYISDYRNENSALRGKVTKFHFSAENSTEIPIQPFEQINVLSRFENAVHLQYQNASLIKDLKLSHHELNQLKEEIDMLKKTLVSENEIKSNNEPMATQCWMWNWFSALPKIVIFAFIFAIVIVFVVASHHHHGGDAHGHYGPHGYEVTIHHHGHHGGHGTSHRYFHIDGHHHHHHGHHHHGHH